MAPPRWTIALAKMAGLGRERRDVTEYARPSMLTVSSDGTPSRLGLGYGGRHPLALLYPATSASTWL